MIVHIALYGLFGLNRVGCLVMVLGVGVQIQYLRKYGEYDFSKFTPSGLWRVGYR
jgi:hypothetical protein